MYCIFSCTIDTRKPFTVSHHQTKEGLVNTWMEQDGKTFDFNICSDLRNDRLKIAKSFDGMVFSASLWGENESKMA